MKKIVSSLLIGYLLLIFLTSFGALQEHFLHLSLTTILTIVCFWMLYRQDLTRISAGRSKLAVCVPLILLLFLVSHVIPLHALAGHLSDGVHQTTTHPCCTPVTDTTIAYAPEPYEVISEPVRLSSQIPQILDLIEKLTNKSPPAFS